MVRQAEVRESHEQLSAAWALYARCSGAGDVVDLDGLRVANARQPWFLAGSQQWLGGSVSKVEMVPFILPAQKHSG